MEIMHIDLEFSRNSKVLKCCYTLWGKVDRTCFGPFPSSQRDKKCSYQLSRRFQTPESDPVTICNTSIFEFLLIFEFPLNSNLYDGQVAQSVQRLLKVHFLTSNKNCWFRGSVRRQSTFKKIHRLFIKSRF